MKKYIASFKSGFDHEIQAESIQQARALADRTARTDGDPVVSVKRLTKPKQQPSAVRFPEDLKAAIHRQAETENRSFNNMVQQMCRAYKEPPKYKVSFYCYCVEESELPNTPGRTMDDDEYERLLAVVDKITVLDRIPSIGEFILLQDESFKYGRYWVKVSMVINDPWKAFHQTGTSFVICVQPCIPSVMGNCQNWWTLD